MTALIGQYDDSSGAPWLKGTAASLLAHVAVVLPFVIHFASSQPITSPVAVMVDYSPEFEVSKVAPELPPGINQQRKVEATSEEQKPKQQEEIKVAEATDAELKVAAQKPRQKTEKKPDTRKKAQQQQREEKGNSTITSRAAPPVQSLVTQRTAAPLDIDSAVNSSKVNWESLVKGKINRVRNYPEDARRRKRTGIVMVAFSVNQHGEILTSHLVNSSGTRSLDKAALEALQKAQPLPAPPGEILYNGVHKVTLPVEFDLLRI